MVGTRMPPSLRPDFAPVNGHTLENRSPPLSLAKNTTVSRCWPVRSSARDDLADRLVEVLDHLVYVATEPPS